MNVINLIFREFVGLFVDDAFLAVAILAVIAGCAAIAVYAGVSGLAMGGLLLAGCVAVLLASVVRGSRRKPR